MPNSAVPIGRPIASTEPNASSRMIIAARRPIASLAPPISASAKMSPPNSRRSPGTWTSAASFLISLPSAVNSSPERSAKLICAYAIFPLREIWRAPSAAYGLATSTSGIFCSTSSNSPSIACCTCGVVDTLAGGEDDLRLHLPVAEARLLEQVERLLALGAGQLELGLERAVQAARQRERRDEQDDPTAEHPTAAAVREAREALQHGGTSLSRGRPRYAAGPWDRPGWHQVFIHTRCPTVAVDMQRRRGRMAGTPERNGPLS